MPIYEFRCEECGAEFERLLEPGATPPPCADCGGLHARRVLSAPSAPFGLVKSDGQKRGQERRNAQLHRRAKARFKQARRRRTGSGGSR